MTEEEIKQAEERIAAAKAAREASMQAATQARTENKGFNPETLRSLLDVSKDLQNGKSVVATVVVRGNKGYKLLDCGQGLIALPSASLPQSSLQVGERLPVIIRETGGSLRATLDIAAAEAALSSK